MRDRLADARLYLCAPACGDDLLRAALAGGVDVIQLRDGSLDDDGVLREAERFRRAADAAGALFVLNDRPDLAVACGADGVHVGQDDASPAEARAVVGPDRIVGRSTHGPEQGAAAAADPDVDYLSIGPVHATPTKPGRAATGLDYVRWAAAHVEKPWFAIGGIDATTISAVVGAGARRVVVVRAITEAGDPERAAAELRAGLGVRVGRA
jgi:thiamine-phosphate pyrophosphorylase